MEPIDLKYILRISSYLRNFKRKSNKLFNFSCWYCGDSEKNPRKARAYFYEKDRACLYHCHNCGKSTNLKKFLSDLDYNLYKEYLKDTLSDDEIKISKDLNKPTLNLDSSIFNDCDNVENIRIAREYLEHRKIPKKQWEFLKYTDSFKKFTNKILPGKFKTAGGDPRIIIPFYTSNGLCFGYQGRALYDSKVKYITIILNDNYPKIWNLNNVNLNKRFYLTEGPFDAMFLENSIAVAGSELMSSLKSMTFNKENAVCILDNQPRNKEILTQYRKCISEGYNIFIWPDIFEEKDINECILAGYTASEMQCIIDSNSFSGLTAELKFNEWSKL